MIVHWVMGVLAGAVGGDSGVATTQAAWDPRQECLTELAKSVKGILKNQDAKTGRFGKAPWVCGDQNEVFPLAAAWSAKDPSNPWYHDPNLLKAIMAGGDILVDEQDPKGMWTFRKKDNSTWGQIYMPWTCSRWVRAYLLIKDAMPAERRAKWERGLLKSYEGISKTCLGQVHNIPCHHAMGLYAAGVAFNRDDWKKQATEFMGKVVEKQSPDGWWSEHVGPVVSYNFVYSEALGVYFALSEDAKVLEALRRAAVFHANLTYPDGSGVETVDERNPYHGGVRTGNVGFSMTPEGRGFLVQQASLARAAHRGMSADEAASFFLYGRTGDAIQTAASRDQYTWTSRDGNIVVFRRRPWFVVASGYTAKVPENRWIQDRQNFFSVFHDTQGLIVGGGNTKLQPYWSNFTIGDPALLKHKEGDIHPKFTPPSGLVHTPASVEVRQGPAGVDLHMNYGTVGCQIQVTCLDPRSVRIEYRSGGGWDQPVEGHLTLMPHVEQKLTTAASGAFELKAGPLNLPAEKVGAWLRHSGWQLSGPVGGSVIWPAKPHDPYKKDGRSLSEAGRLVVSCPLTKDRAGWEAVLSIPGP